VEPILVAQCRREPEVEDVDAAASELWKRDPKAGDIVVGIGGGAALDMAKALAARAMDRRGDSIQDFLEGVGKGWTLDPAPLPVLAVPTTAGTGSEATRNGVISRRRPSFKKSLRDERLMPRIALVDPELTISNPPRTTAHSGMDALCQLIESHISRKAQPIPQGLALRGMRGLIEALRTAFREPSHQAARETCAHAAMLSGMALANSGLGFAHGVAAALGSECGVGHGLACAMLLPTALRLNAETAAARMVEMTEALLGRPIPNPEAASRAIFEEVASLADDLRIPTRLSEVGVTAASMDSIVAGSRGSSMSGNPRELSDAEIRAALEAML
jgi:alcohol dehydrogenase class IV